jgi:hypothetical protein
MPRPRCPVCRAPEVRGRTCADCKAFVQLLRSLWPRLRPPTDALAERVARYRERAAARRPLFGEG